MKPVILFLTCANKKEAETIAKVLLGKKLAACAKMLPVSSSSWWKGEIENSDEVLLLLETVEEKFEQIEEQVRKLHSYELPGLLAFPVVKTTKDVKKWLKDALE